MTERADGIVTCLKRQGGLLKDEGARGRIKGKKNKRMRSSRIRKANPQDDACDVR
jgi:hypothetical protein